LSSIVLGPSLNCSPLLWQARDHAASNTVRLVDDSAASPESSSLSLTARAAYPRLIGDLDRSIDDDV